MSYITHAQAVVLLQAVPVSRNLLVASPTFAAAPACKGLPSGLNAVPDNKGRLWCWQNSTSCAYKDQFNRPLLYPNYQPGDWLHTPSCTNPPFAVESVAVSAWQDWH